LASTSDEVPKKKPYAKRKAFTRAKNRLMDADAVRIFGDHVWRVQDDA
jgi:hypothetical protein